MKLLDQPCSGHRVSLFCNVVDLAEQLCSKKRISMQAFNPPRAGNRLRVTGPSKSDLQGRGRDTNSEHPSLGVIQPCHPS